MGRHLLFFTLILLASAIPCSRCSAETQEEIKFLNAVTSGDEKTVGSMISKSPSLAKTANQFGASALVLSLGNGHPEIVELLLKHGADPNGTGVNRPIALVAIHSVNPRELKALLNAGALARGVCRNGAI